MNLQIGSELEKGASKQINRRSKANRGTEVDGANCRCTVEVAAL